MDASFSRRKILDPSELRALNARSDLWGGAQMASHVGAILIAGYLHALALGSWWVLLRLCLGRSDQLSLCRPARIEPRHGLQNPQGERGFWPDHRVFHDLSA